MSIDFVYFIHCRLLLTFPTNTGDIDIRLVTDWLGVFILVITTCKILQMMYVMSIFLYTNTTLL